MRGGGGANIWGGGAGSVCASAPAPAKRQESDRAVVAKSLRFRVNFSSREWTSNALTFGACPHHAPKREGTSYKNEDQAYQNWR